MKNVPGSIRKSKKNIFFLLSKGLIRLIYHCIESKKKNNEKVENWKVNTRILLCKVNQVRRTADLIALCLVTRSSKLIRNWKGKVSFFGP